MTNDFYDNLIRATDNKEEIAFNKYGTITEIINSKLVSVLEDDGLRHDRVPVLDGVTVHLGDRVVLGFVGNSVYEAFVAGDFDGISSGGGGQVQADYAQTDSTQVDYIKNKPSIPTKTSDLTNDSGFITNSYHDSSKQDVISDLSTIRTNASKGASSLQPYDNVSELTNDVGYLTQHQSLSNYYTKSEVNSEINNHHDSSKQDKLTAGTNITIVDNVISATGSGGTTDYSQLSNKPKINNVELTGNKSSSDLGINIPTKTSDLTNDSGFIDNAYHDSTKVDKTSMVWEIAYEGDGFTIYQNNTFYYIVIQKSVTWETANTNVTIATIPEQYRPVWRLRMKGHSTVNIFVNVESNGDITARCDSVRTATANASFMYPLIN